MIGQPNSVLVCKCIASFKSIFAMPEMPDIWPQQILKSSEQVVPHEVLAQKTCVAHHSRSVLPSHLGEAVGLQRAKESTP